jgi:chemotaxis protein MotB
MGKKKCPECPKCLPGWLVQFGDLMSLLLCFFILLLSMATMDKKKVEEYFDIMRRSMGFLEGAADTAEAEKEKQSKDHRDSSEAGNQGDMGGGNDNGEFAQEMEDVAHEYNDTSVESEDEEVTVTVKNNNEFVMDIPSSLMFGDGDYKISNDQSKRFIRKIARIIRTMSDGMDIEVVGHASSVEAQGGSDIPRNTWDLSALRSIAIVQELIKNKIDPERLKVSAFGSYRPKGESYEENRRVELRFVSSNNDADEFGSDNFFDRIGN